MSFSAPVIRFLRWWLRPALFVLTALLIAGAMACSIVSKPETVVTPTVVPTPLPPITQGAIPFIETPECATVVSVNTPATTAASASPTVESTTTRDALVRRQRDVLGKTDGETRAFLQAQDWVSTPDANALVLLELIARAEECRESMADYRPSGSYERAIEVLRSASERPWYLDGLTTEELATTADLYEVYLALSKIHLGSPIVVAEPGVMISQAVERGSAGAVVLPRSGRRSLVVLASQDSQAHDVFKQAADTLPAIERFGGVLNPAGVVFLVLDVESLCGQTPTNVSSGAMQLVFIGTKCLSPIAVFHELTHAFLGADYPGWYTEGMADFLASYLTESLNGTYAQYIARLRDSGTRINLNQRFVGLVDPSQYAAGFVFIKETFDILGFENMALLARGLRPRATGAEIVAEMRRLAPVDRRADLEAVIALRVGP